MEGRHFYIFTGLQIVAVCTMLWFLATWDHPWNTQRYIGWF